MARSPRASRSRPEPGRPAGRPAGPAERQRLPYSGSLTGQVCQKGRVFSPNKMQGVERHRQLKARTKLAWLSKPNGYGSLTCGAGASGAQKCHESSVASGVVKRSGVEEGNNCAKVGGTHGFVFRWGFSSILLICLYFPNNSSIFFDFMHILQYFLIYFGKSPAKIRPWRYGYLPALLRRPCLGVSEGRRAAGSPAGRDLEAS